MNRLWIAVALAALVSPLQAEERGADLELVTLSGQGLLRLGVQVEIDGRPLATLWDDNFAALTAFCDRNSDGHLDEAEAKRLPSIQALREVLTVGFAPALGEPPAWKDLDSNSNGKAIAAEVASLYRRAGLGVPLVGAGVMPFSADLTNSLLRLLDVDGDQQVDEKEWQLAAQALPKLDRNDDELVGAGELVSRVLYPGAAGSLLLAPPRSDQPPTTHAAATLIVLPSDRADTAWAHAVVKRRDRDSDGLLSAEESGLGAPRMAVLDANEDRLLSPAELAAWRQGEADAVFIWRMTTAGGKRPTLALATASEKPAEWGALNITRGGMQFAVRTDEGKLAKAANRVREHFAEEFTSADANADGILVSDEISKRKEAVWESLLAFADRDGDAQLTKAELDAWLDLQSQLASGQVLLTALDGGAGLFELLDANHDGALSLKELRESAGRVRESGALVDGKLDVRKLPSLLLVTISHGYPLSPLGIAERTGPAWFLAMDRNADGYVSRREFSGPADVFQKLDADQDSLIAPLEAAQAMP